MVALSLLVVSKGLAASPADAAGPIVVDAAKISAETPPPLAADPVLTVGETQARRAADLRNLITPAALQRLVALHTGHTHALQPSLACMARTVYLEAANQTLPGQLAVAQVILNRTRTGDFPRHVCAVVSQPGQFATAPAGAATPAAARPWDTAVAIAAIAQEDRLPQVAPGALFFHADYVRPSWSRRHERIAQIGDHIFYR
jgi:spore germination cell wall hydrolase CwlJ-like protein